HAQCSTYPVAIHLDINNSAYPNSINLKGGFFMPDDKFSRLRWFIVNLQTQFMLTHQTSGKA
ncbi:hypothetical protein, partial [Shewanella sp. S1-49-MNA-CIBAN-0167]